MLRNTVCIRHRRFNFNFCCSNRALNDHNPTHHSNLLKYTTSSYNIAILHSTRHRHNKLHATHHKTCYSSSFINMSNNNNKECFYIYVYLNCIVISLKNTTTIVFMIYQATVAVFFLVAMNV